MKKLKNHKNLNSQKYNNSQKIKKSGNFKRVKNLGKEKSCAHDTTHNNKNIKLQNIRDFLKILYRSFLLPLYILFL